MEADFIIMASVGYSLKRGFVNKYEREYLEKESI